MSVEKRRPEIPPGPHLVVGLARSGIAAALALRERGEQVIGVDSGSPAGLEALEQAGVELHLQSDGSGLLDRVNTLVKSPGVPVQAPVIERASAEGKHVLGELELGWRMLPNEFIAVTGTNGKTTTVEWIGHIHREAGLPVAVAGNVGAALSGLVGRTERRVVVVCEASSFQLEDTLAFAPEAAALLNLAPDHLNRHGTIEAYSAAKLRVFAHQSPADMAVLGSGLDHLPIPGEARRVLFGRDSAAQLCERDGALHWQGGHLLDVAELRLRGRHNVENAMAAAAVCLARGVDPDAVRSGLRSFAGVPHRLEQIPIAGEVTFVNDSKATNVASTLVALEAMSGERPTVHLILGGQGKGQDFAALRDPVRQTCRAVYLIGEDAQVIAEALVEAGVELVYCGELELAVTRAAAAAEPGEVVLLSPGCASFDQFSDFEERGERFWMVVQALLRR